MNNEENAKFKRTLGGILTGIGLLLLLFACAAFMSSNNRLMGFDVEGARKIAPAVLGFIVMVSGISLINRA
ncbi:hypothetical protein [Emticicia sp. BO119]|uniref:hypothetical protein n=1 Tax=Emticicia sp. BO119 TaxID=2757768 RepID=UPI0015F00093|nr:hypothetical protein [Emticicia sp. BO119]MBA4849166.1 hypothetical protein [Emticicia sp. BO119]